MKALFIARCSAACHRILTSESSAGHDLPQLSQKPSPSTGRRSHELGRTAAAAVVKRTATVERNKSRFSQIVSHFHRPGPPDDGGAASGSAVSYHTESVTGISPYTTHPVSTPFAYTTHTIHLNTCICIRTYIEPGLMVRLL